MIQIPSILGYWFYLGAARCRRTSSCLWLQTLAVADVMTQNRQEDSDFIFFIFFFHKWLAPRHVLTGRISFQIKCECGGFPKLQIAEISQRDSKKKKKKKVLCMLIACCGGRVLLWCSSGTETHGLLPCYRFGHERQCPWTSCFDFVPLITIFLCKLHQGQHGRAGFSLLPSGGLGRWLEV